MSDHRDALAKAFALDSKAHIERMPMLFEDSSHDIYRVRLEQENYVIKQLNWASVQGSDFWRVMHTLFAFDLAEQIQQFSGLYAQLSEVSLLQIPHLINQAYVDSRPAIFTDSLAGVAASHTAVTPRMVKDLAQHLTALHQVKSHNFGAVYCDNKTLRQTEWATHLKRCLPELLTRLPATEVSRLQAGIDEDFQPESFVLMMPDLRWDQFLQQAGQLSALTDLDAFVYAPVALDWVLLEYLLDEQQAELFKASYAVYHAIPRLQKVRSVYRAILFEMNVLGEKNYQAWCAQPYLFA